MAAESFERTAQLNRQWATMLLDACAKHGITDFFMAPGSRCTPLTMEVARRKQAGTSGNEITIHQHFDERALAFCAVGFGKAAHRAGAFICTSGTAVANAFPAVIEAAAEDTPLVLLTADRPPELRGTGANQTIDQVDLFGRYPRKFVDLECPSDDADVAKMSKVSARIADALESSRNGPVHINCMFREPLFEADGPSVSGIGFQPVRRNPSKDNAQAGSLGHVAGGDTLVIASGCRREIALAAKALAKRLACPFLADVTSGLRSLAYDFAVTGLNSSLPQTVIHIGRRITSKRLLTWIERANPACYLHINETDQPIDPLHKVTQHITGDVASVCHNLRLTQSSSAGFLATWQAASETACATIAEAMTGDEISEPAIARQIAEQIPMGHGLFLGNSMPVRDMDAFGFWEDDRNLHVASNRGASGIDGTIATAVGFAAGIASATTAVIGDLAALHDLNALALVRSSRQPIVLVIINNDGGGIFHFLPIAKQTEPFEQYFGTPHGRTFASAAQMFDLSYQAPATLVDFRTQYAAALKSSSSTVIEVTTDRIQNQSLHAQLLENVQEKVSAATSQRPNA